MSSRVVIGLVVLGVLAFAPAAGATPLYSDPLGDTFNTGTHDVVSYAGDLTTVIGHVYFAVNFSGPVAPASAFRQQRDGLPRPGHRQGRRHRRHRAVGRAGARRQQLDQLRDRQLRRARAADRAGGRVLRGPGQRVVPPRGRWTSSAGDEHVGGAVPIAFGPSGFSLAIPLAMLGNPVNPFFNFGGLVGDFFSATDRFPDGAVAAVVTPEPSSVVLFGAAGLAAWGFMRRRKASR